MRTKVVALLVSLAALWAFAAFVTLREGLNLLWLSTLDDHVGSPSEDLVQALQLERRLSLVYLGGTREDQRSALVTQRAQTDQVVANFKTLASASSVQLAASPAGEQRIRETFAQLDKLTDGRASIDAGRVDRTHAAAFFRGVLDSVFRMYESLGELDDKEVAKDVRTYIALYRAQEVLSQEDALLAGVLAGGEFKGTEHPDFVRLVGAQRFLFAEAAAELPAVDRARYDEMLGSAPFSRFRTLEDRVVDNGGIGEPLPVTATEWRIATEDVFSGLANLQTIGTTDVVGRGVPVAIGVLVRLALAGVLGLIAVIASIIVSITTARRLIRQLERLRNAARDLASYRLPRVVERLQHGERVDVEHEAPPLDFGRDEIGQVGEAFNQVQETAIRVAVEQAELRRSVRDVFLSLARRSQALLPPARPARCNGATGDRLRAACGALPRRPPRHPYAPQRGEPHRALGRDGRPCLAQAGANGRCAPRCPGRSRGLHAGHRPAGRLRVAARARGRRRDPPAGRAHRERGPLLAAADPGAHRWIGRRLWLRGGDRGPWLGMSPEELATANEQLRNPPEFRLTSTARLGLYVVGKLAERHGIRVRLTESPYGGTTAIVLLPGSLMADDGADDGGRPDATQLDGYRPGQLAGAGRHRLQSDLDRGRAEKAAAVALESPVRESRNRSRGSLFPEVGDNGRLAVALRRRRPPIPGLPASTPSGCTHRAAGASAPPPQPPLEPSLPSESPKLTPSGAALAAAQTKARRDTAGRTARRRWAPTVRPPCRSPMPATATMPPGTLTKGEASWPPPARARCGDEPRRLGSPRRDPTHRSGRTPRRPLRSRHRHHRRKRQRRHRLSPNRRPHPHRLHSGRSPRLRCARQKREADPVVQRASATVDISWLVNDLVDRVAHVHQAVVLSHDGILIAKSHGLSREDAEHLSAVAAGMHGLARGAGRRFGRGAVRQTIIEMEAGFIFVTAGGNGACIAVLATEDADVGLIAYEMEMLVARVGQYLSTPVRTTAIVEG